MPWLPQDHFLNINTFSYLFFFFFFFPEAQTIHPHCSGEGQAHFNVISWASRQLHIRSLLIQLLLLGLQASLLPEVSGDCSAGAVGHAEEQGGVAAELDERRDQYRRNHLVRDLAPEAQFGPRRREALNTAET